MPKFWHIEIPGVPGIYLVGGMADGGIAFTLPPDKQRQAMDGICRCGHCTPPAMWDTLRVTQHRYHGCWTVHWPDLGKECTARLNGSKEVPE